MNESVKHHYAKKKRVLVVSHVLPFPGKAGQERRVYFTLRALRKHFHVTFLTFAPRALRTETVARLAEFCDDVICLESLYATNRFSKFVYRSIATGASALSSLKPSNYIIGELEFSKRRIENAIGDRKFDLVLYEYWHAYKTTSFFKDRGIPCVLDMHNILWKARQGHSDGGSFSLVPMNDRRLAAYRKNEESAWRRFDALISINRAEDNYVRARDGNGKRIFYAPMGIELEKWRYSWKPNQARPKIAYYGGLGSPHNEESALSCFNELMPSIWSRFPSAELWIVGSDPSKRLRSLPSIDKRVHVTGFVEDAQTVLSEMSVILCPWKGQYGFRSRLVEVLALGIPLVTTPDAIYGMELTDKRDVLLGESDEELCDQVLELLEDKDSAERQSRTARQTVEKIYSIARTYDRLSIDLLTWVTSREKRAIA
jgi:polysaccharide biosynthesis protein PslH